MKLVTISKVIDGVLHHEDTNEGRVKDFLRKRNGLRVRQMLEDYTGNISDEKIGYFEGALIPVLTHFQNKERDTSLPPLTREEMRELAKREFNGVMITENDGTVVKIGKSTRVLSNKGYGEMIDRMVEWMVEQQIPIPDPDEYKKWRDSAPPKGQRYFEEIWLPLYDLDYVRL